MAIGGRTKGKVKKWVLIAATALVIAVGGLLWFYQQIRGDYEELHREARQRALNDTSLVHIEKTELFAGANVYTILFGTNEEGQPLIVWVSAEELHEELAENGVSAEQVRAIAEQRNGPLRSVRLTPGKWRDTYVWELFYTRLQDGEEYYFYDYYRFSDGQWQDTYRLKAR